MVDEVSRVAKMKQNPNWIAAVARSRKGGKVGRDGRISVYDRGRYRPRARVVMEQHLGRPLDRTEHVHHRNEDPSDDRIENLEIKTPAEHRSLHERLLLERGTKYRTAKCEPGCTCRKHLPRTRYWSGGKKCRPGCTCRKHQEARPIT